MRILIAVTHLLGAGHLTRAAALARAFAEAGHETVLVSGGSPAPLVRLDGVRLVQLPPLRIEGFDFGRLIGPDGLPAGEEIFAARREALLTTLHETAPDAVITELFPFGRRGLAPEFLALVEAARALARPPLILASVRDILVPPDRPAKVAEAHARVTTLYDAVLVHGDEALAPLDASWPVDDAIRSKLRYTGYVDEGAAIPPPDQREGIVVAAGSSAAGLGLFRAAIGAARKRPDLGWRVLVGHGIPNATLASLSEGVPPGTVMRARADYRALLAGARVSVSQCGYNTAVDLMVTGTPAVLVPFEAGHETEQRLRAERLTCMGRARIVPEVDLSPETVLAAVLDAPPPPTGPPPALDGAARTVALVERMRRERAFARLREALDGAGDVRVWWRDDDAVAATPALDRLLALAGPRPILIAAIPARIEPSLARSLSPGSNVSIGVHGLAHDNHAPPGAKPAEFGPHRPLPVLRDEAKRSLALAREKVPDRRLLPVFVPPWNRIDPTLAAALPALGYLGLSTAKGSHAAALDVIDWRGTRSLREPVALLESIIAHVESGNTEPLGLLTHHLAHDKAVWDFLAELIACLDHPAVCWCDPRDLFHSPVDAPIRAPMCSAGERPRTG